MSIELSGEEVVAYAPEFASLVTGETPDYTTIEMFIDLSRSFVNENFFGSKAKNALLNMTCHILTKLRPGGSSGGGQAGAVSSERVGDLQVSYAIPTASNLTINDAILASTQYGQIYLMLRRSIPATPRVT